jgi:hypothetical protein
LWLPIGSYGRSLVLFKIQNLANLGLKRLFVDVVRSFFLQMVKFTSKKFVIFIYKSFKNIGG